MFSRRGRVTGLRHRRRPVKALDDQKLETAFNLVNVTESRLKKAEQSLGRVAGMVRGDRGLTSLQSDAEVALENAIEALYELGAAVEMRIEGDW